MGIGNGDQRKPFVASSGSGLALAYYHGVATYIRDHFHVDNLRISGISGGCSTILALSMGIDLFQVLLLGLHQKKQFLRQGIYLNDFDAVLEDTCRKLTSMGITDEDVSQLSARQCCFMGVTQCFPWPCHRCVPAPPNLRDLAALMLSSMSVVPFFRTPGVFEGKYCIDGGFSDAFFRARLATVDGGHQNSVLALVHDRSSA